MRRSWWLYALLLALALAAGVSTPTTAPDSPVPSVSNPGPRGTKLLRRWLEQTGRDVRVLDTALDPGDARTLVLAAPIGHAVSKDELAQLQQFVEAGGTLVYLRPRRSAAQPNLDDWLKLETGPAPQRDANATDLLGVSDPVTLLPGLKSLRIVADDTIVSQLAEAVPVTKAGALWWWPRGKGQVFIGAGADLAEASRLELDDNAAFWASLPPPIAFDELHQAPRAKPALTESLIAALVQLAFCGLAFVLVFAPRLGPARPTPVEQHRSSLEYVRSMAALTQEARVEPELARELCARLQRILEVPASELPVKPEGVTTPQEFLELSKRCASLEAEARGLSSRT
jgi:hypothetical protein